MLSCAFRRPFALESFPVLVLVCLGLLSSTAATAWHEPGELETIVSFDAAQLETPEGLVIDERGNIYVTLAFTGEIVKVTPEGERSSFAQLPVAAPGLPCSPGGLPAILGTIAQGPLGYFYVTFNPCEDELKGVWVVSPDGDVGLLASLPPDALSNGITRVGPWLFVADSNGFIWRVPLWGGSAEVWNDDPLLQPIPEIFGPGPNGIQFFRGSLYVSNSDTAQILRIPLAGGAKGPVEVHADLPFGCDDFAFDVRGTIYCTTDPANRLLEISPDGSTTEVILSADDGLDGPTAAAFGRRGLDRFNLYITNAAFPFFTTSFNPTLQRLRVPFPGARR